MWIKGSIVQKWVDSKLLVGNPAGVPAKRPLVAYVPALSEGQRFPVLYCLAPWTGAGRAMLEWRAFKESLPERIERLVASGMMPPAVVVCPDLYTDYGGSQYIDSEFFGPHARHIVEEIFPFVEKEFPVLPGSKHRGVFGRSSGGYGALRLAMDFPGAVAGIACHSADLGFETMLRGELIGLAEGLMRYEGSVTRFREYVMQANKLSGHDIHLLMLLGSAGFYSPNPDHLDGFELPIDLYSGELIQDTWQKWLRHDPVVRVDQTHRHLSQLKYFYFECGTRDQYHLLYGARQLHAKLNSLGCKHFYEEFEDNHSGTDYRYDISLPELVKAIS